MIDLLLICGLVTFYYQCITISSHVREIIKGEEIFYVGSQT